MKHYNYKITNIDTGEFYVEVRSCKCEIEDDKYMGSSSIWTKAYIKEHKDVLKKEILEVFATRILANGGEVKLLKEVKNNPLCINKYFDYTPDVTGTKQTPEWIAKRCKSGKLANFYGHHHTEETKKQISKTLKGREITQAHRDKIAKAISGIKRSEETKKKVSLARQKTYVIYDTINKTKFVGKILEFISLHPHANYRAQGFRDAACGKIPKYKNYLVRAANKSDLIRKSGKNGEPLEAGNPVGSIGNE